MPLLLSDILQAGYRKLGQLNVSRATGGSTTTVLDTTLINSAKDGAWNGGCLFVIRDAGGAQAAPENEFKSITGFTRATGTFTLDSALTSAAASGDVYGYTSQYYPLHQMIQAANDALTDMGDLDLVDTLTLAGLANTTEYTASVAWKRGRPTRVDIQGRIGFPSDNKWQEHKDFTYVPAAPGVTGLIIFNGYPLIGRQIRVWYRDTHPVLYNFNDPVAEVLSPDTVLKAFVSEALEWQNKRSQGGDPYLIQAGNQANQALANSKIEYPAYHVKKGPRLLILGDNTPATDGFKWPLPPP